MFKFNKNEELYDVIDKQKDQISRYEGRLRDLVHAYKSLQKEKEALEESMKALTTPSSGGGKKPSTLDENTEALNEDESTEPDIQHLQSQLHTLTTSLSTMSDEKKKLVLVYQAEKKQFKHEHEVEVTKLEEETQVLLEKNKLLGEELTRVKEKLRNQQSDHEQEQSTHSIILREIQKMLNDERTKNESLELAMRDLNTATRVAEIEVQQHEDYKRRVRQLEDELSEVRARLEVAEHEANTPSPILMQLQSEMSRMKKDHMAQLEFERSRVAEVEQRERMMAQAEEVRVGDLEGRLVQISNVMGLYDGTRQKDLSTIQRLKDTNTQLELENISLKTKLDGLSIYKSDEDLGIDEIKSRMLSLQELLKCAASKSNEPVDISDILSSIKIPCDDFQQLYLESQEELLKVKEEFDKYKVRAQSVLKNIKGGGGGGPSGSNRELEEARKQLQAARDRHFNLRGRCEDLEARCKEMEVEHKRAMAKQATLHAEDTQKMLEQHKNQVSSIEQEVKNQRERTVSMLMDKDKEIKQLKVYTSTYHSEYQNVERTASRDYDITDDSVAEILTKGGKDTNLMHYVEQLARKDVTINNVRRKKKELELQVRQLQDAGIMRDEANAQQVAELKGKIEQIKRGISRENANNEYVKNVLCQYLTTVDGNAKQKMLVAIATILQFSPDEMKRVGIRTK
nr:GRIP and coiled-coil domain-containing protein 1 [Ciona intestinalis]|eukprot:XP_026694844.1 GRIP and coiled-coil domain-containing protein 1 [Ciona intestinalis]